MLLVLAATGSLAQRPSRDAWTGTWSAAPEGERNAAANSAGITYRQIVHVSVGGSTLRIIVTNEFGAQALTIGAAAVALPAKGSATVGSSSKSVTFGGQTSVTLPAGASMWSDPVEFALAPLSDLAVSLFVPAQPLSRSTVHSYALQTNYTFPGNGVKDANPVGAAAFGEYAFLRGVEVRSDAPAAVVTLGDSITDGAASAKDTNGRWPDVLARRLQGDPTHRGMAVLNAGLNGNRLLHDDDEFGDSALKRLDRDVLAQAGVRYLIVFEGINDIGHIVKPSADDPADSAQNLIRALQQIVLRAHTHGIKVIGATILPYENCKYASARGEAMRQAVNEWIRGSGTFDAVADFDKVLRDPAHPARLLDRFDSGDHLHPNAAGLAALANSIDLGMFSH